MAEPTPPHTYKLRRGRITAGQAAALQRLSSVYGIAISESPLNVVRAFGRLAPLVLEVGFGMGEATVQMAHADPTRDLLAVDVHTPGVGALLRAIEAEQLTNVRVLEGDARHVLRVMLDGVSLDEVRVYFPDPWPKARHAKRRLLTPAFCDLVAARLRPGGVLHVATDWEPYAHMALRVLRDHPGFDIDGAQPRPEHRPVTRFEQQGRTAGRQSYDLLATRLP